MANITVDGNFTSRLNQALSSPPAGIIELFSALNIFLSITASLGNAVILIALHKVSSIYPPTKLFFRCLAVTDLCVGLTIQPLFATSLLSDVQRVVTNVLVQVEDFLSWMLCGVSLLTSTAISVDRLLALLLGLRYRRVVILRRVRVVIICFWLIGALGGSIRMWRRDITFLLTFTFFMFSLATSVFCYTRIQFKLQHQQAQLQNHFPQGLANGGGIPLNIARYKKSVSSIFWVQLALFACYVPWGIVFVLFANGIEYDLAWKASATLVYFNSSLNPILYCWKIRKVKQAVKDIIRQLKCFF